VLAVELGADVGLPVFVYLRELLGNVDLGHEVSSERRVRLTAKDYAPTPKVAKKKRGGWSEGWHCL
jgi:hypothetical protein